MSETYVEDSRDPDRDDGEQTPIAVDLPDEEGDAGVPDPTFDDLDGEEY